MKKEDTRERIIKRKYEQTHKEERKKASEQFNTRLPRKIFEEIEAFLEKYKLRKIDLVYAGYTYYQQKLGLIPKDDKEQEKKNN